MENITDSEPRVWPVTGYRLAHGYVSGLICTTGVILNIFNAIVWSRKSMRTSTNILLTVLAVADSISLLLYGIYALYFFIITGPSELIYHSEGGMYLVVICFHEFIAFHTYSNWLTISLAIFRYIKVCKSNIAKKYCNTKRAKLTVVIVFIATTLATVPFYPYYEVYNGGEDNSEYSGYWIRKTTFARTYIEYQTALLWLYGVIFKLIPSTAMIILSALMVKELRHAKQRQKNLSTNVHHKDSNTRRGYNRTTIMLVIIVMIYVLMELPIGISAFLSGLEGGESHFFYFLLYSSIGDILDLTALVNGTLNFFVYYILSQQFRMVFKQVILGKLFKRYAHSAEITVSTDNVELSTSEEMSRVRVWKSIKKTLSNKPSTITNGGKAT